MTAQDPTVPPAWPAAPEMRDGGTMLREAREAAGLSLEMVSQQLKLAPRQVKALEDSEFELLPGRTFVRGFARNYARLLQLDPEAIVNALPGTTGRSGLEAPPLTPTTMTMGELPSAAKSRPAVVRWAALVALLALVAAGAGYALWQNRAQRAAAPAGTAAELPAAEPAAVAPSPAQSPASAPAVAPAASPAPAPGGGTLLPNPTISAPLDSGPAPAAGLAPAAAPPSGPAAPRLDAAPGASSTGEIATIAPIAVAARAASWVEVKDGAGRLVLKTTIQPGQSPSIVGSPPFDVVIGNAPDVTLSYRGQAVDLAPFTRGGVARLTLK